MSLKAGSDVSRADFFHSADVINFNPDEIGLFLNEKEYSYLHI